MYHFGKMISLKITTACFFVRNTVNIQCKCTSSIRTRYSEWAVCETM